jgi:hypothetical protein
MPGKNGFHTYAEEWERQLRERYSWASKFCKDVFPKVQRTVPRVVAPQEALQRARDSIFTVIGGVLSWFDFVDYTQRALLELEAFRDWWSNFIIVKDNIFVAAPRRSSQGILVPNMEIFRECCLTFLVLYQCVQVNTTWTGRSTSILPLDRDCVV